METAQTPPTPHTPHTPTRTRIQRRGAAILAMGAAAALAACGTQASGSTSDAPAPAKKPVTLIIDNDWTGGDRIKVIDAWLALAKEKYPHISTDLRATANSQDKTLALFSSDSQGDLFQLDQHLLPVFGPKGLLQDIGPTLATLKFDPKKLYDIENITHWNGKRHGLLVQIQPSTGVYNRSAFEEAGIKLPTPSWTWDDYLEASRRLNRPTDNRWGTNLDYRYPYEWFWSANVPYLDGTGKKTFWDSSQSREVLQWLTDLVQRHRVAASPAETAEKKLSFNNGNVAIQVHTVPTPSITAGVAGKFQWEVLPFPKHPKTGKAITLVTGANYLVTTRARERGVLAEAVQVLTEFFDPTIQQMYLSGLNIGSLPIVKSLMESPQALQQYPPTFKENGLGILPAGRNYDKIVGFLDFHNAISAEFVKAANGEVSVEQAAVNMTRACDAALAQAAR